jgi:hypothetical protein
MIIIKNKLEYVKYDKLMRRVGSSLGIILLNKEERA